MGARDLVDWEWYYFWWQWVIVRMIGFDMHRSPQKAREAVALEVANRICARKARRELMGERQAASDMSLTRRKVRRLLRDNHRLRTLDW